MGWFLLIVFNIISTILKVKAPEAHLPFLVTATIVLSVVLLSYWANKPRKGDND